MIKNPKYLNKFENEFIKNDILSYDQAISLFEGMWREALSLNVFHAEGIMEGIQKNIKIARILKSCSKNC